MLNGIQRHFFKDLPIQYRLQVGAPDPGRRSGQSQLALGNDQLLGLEGSQCVDVASLQTQNAELLFGDLNRVVERSEGAGAALKYGFLEESA